MKGTGFLTNRPSGRGPDPPEGGLQVALRPGADPGVHLRFPQIRSKFSPPLADPLPNRVGKREVCALYSIIDRGVKIGRVRRFVGPQNKQFAEAGLSPASMSEVEGCTQEIAF